MKSELIDKLMEQATENHPYNTINSDGKVLFSTDNYGVNLNKFAELLIKEIVSELQLEINRSCRTLTYDLDDHIKMDAREDALDDAMLIVKSILE